MHTWLLLVTVRFYTALGGCIIRMWKVAITAAFPRINNIK